MINKIKALFRNKRFVKLVVVVVLILLAVTLRGKKSNIPTNTGTPSDFNVNTQEENIYQDESNVSHSPRAVNDAGLYDRPNPPSPEQSSAEIDKIRDDLPIFVESFKTSGDVTTSISIGVLASGRQDILNIHINGINYNENAISDANPQYKAFVESLQRAKSELEKRKVDTTKLLISFGTRQYIVETANNWAKVSGIL